MKTKDRLELQLLQVELEDISRELNNRLSDIEEDICRMNRDTVYSQDGYLIKAKLNICENCKYLSVKEKTNYCIREIEGG